MIIFFAALVAILYHLGIMQRVVRWVGGAIGWITGIGRGRIAVGGGQHLRRPEQIAAGRPPLSGRLAPSQLFTIMTVGMAGVAGTILAAYAALLGEQAICPICSPPPSCRRPAAS